MAKIRILGISFDVYGTSACLLEDGRIVAACPEERLNRQKLTKEFPRRAINYCLEEGTCGIGDISHVAIGWNPGIHANAFNPRFSRINRWRAEQLYSVPNFWLSMQNPDRVEEVVQYLKTDRAQTQIIYVDHHKAHAAFFFFSPYREAAILTCDGRGEEDTLTLSMGRDFRITEIDRQIFPHSVGMLYGAVTQFLGFQRDSDEWKVMALYSYHAGRDNPYLDRLRKLVTFLPNGKFEINLNYFSYYLHDVKTWYSPRFVAEFGKPRINAEEYDQRHIQIAHALQTVTEEIMAHVLNYLHERTGCDSVVLSGGSFMNSVFNGKVTDLTPFRDVFVPSCPDDSGVSIGAALHVYHQVLSGTKRHLMVHNYYGPEFCDDEIRRVLDSYRLTYKVHENVADYAARLLTAGRIIGWFQGKMEFGQRALGNRSILADPRRPEMKDELNARIKYRESFRPFAPAILGEYVDEYFDVRGQRDVPFMERVYMVREEKRRLIPAVTHVDGSGRLQTVNPKTNGLFFDLISRFHERTGIPLVLNTSFNLNGEPIVCSPTDAVRTFYSCGLDALVMGHFVLEKGAGTRLSDPLP
jgi:carbamoyltransferase